MSALPHKLTKIQSLTLAAVGAGKVKGRLDAFSNWKKIVLGANTRSLNCLIIKGLVEEIEVDEPGSRDLLRYSLTEAGRTALEILTENGMAGQERKSCDTAAKAWNSLPGQEDTERLGEEAKTEEESA